MIQVWTIGYDRNFDCGLPCVISGPPVQPDTNDFKVIPVKDAIELATALNKILSTTKDKDTIELATKAIDPWAKVLKG